MRNPTVSVNPSLLSLERGIPREASEWGMANRRAYHEMRRSIRLTDLQRSIAIGTLLGDGSLIETFSKNNLRLQIDHCAAQKSYVFWKYEALKPLVLTSPTYQRGNRSWRFRTISHPELTALGKRFYRDRRKIVPKEIASLLTPIGLAVWFMDDGGRARDDGYILNTQSFRRYEVELLRDVLRQKFNLHPLSLHIDKSGWRLYIRKAAMQRLRLLIEPFLLPDLMYKLRSPVETTRWPPAVAAGVKI